MTDFCKKLRAEKSRTFEVWAIGVAEDTVEFEGCEREYVAATVGTGFTNQYVYYQRYQKDRFYKLRREELVYLQLAGKEIPF